MSRASRRFVQYLVLLELLKVDISIRECCQGIKFAINKSNRIEVLTLRLEVEQCGMLLIVLSQNNQLIKEALFLIQNQFLIRNE